MVTGDGLAYKTAQKAGKEQDRIRNNRASGPPPRSHMVLTDKEKKAMGITNDRATIRAKARFLRILLLLFGVVVIIVLLWQTAVNLPDADRVYPADAS